LLQKQRQGQSLSDEEKAYLQRARDQRARESSGRSGAEEEKGKESTGMTPLTELDDGEYKGQTGGLYGNGRNSPPATHQAAAKRELTKIQPLDAKEKPAVKHTAGSGGGREMRFYCYTYQA